MRIKILVGVWLWAARKEDFLFVGSTVLVMSGVNTEYIMISIFKFQDHKMLSKTTAAYIDFNKRNRYNIFKN